MINPAVFIGMPLTYKNNIKIYPPTVKEVIQNPRFWQFLQILTMTQEDIEDEFTKREIDLSKLLTPLEFLLANCYENDDITELSKEAFHFFFKSEPIFSFETKEIVLKNSLKNATSLETLPKIDESNFFDIQNLIREVCGLNKVDPPVPNEHPKIKRMKAKARLRDRIKAKQGGGINLSTSLTAICCMGIGITPLNIGELSYATVSALIERYQEKEKYDLDIKSLLAGADSKKIKPKYWIRNLE